MPGQRKRVVATEILHDPPLSRGIDNLGGQYHVRVFSEKELPGRGCIFCGICVEQCTHNLYSPQRPHGVFSMEEEVVDGTGEKVGPTHSAGDGQLLVKKVLHIQEEECCNCKRCVKMCPRRSIEIFKSADYHDIGNPLTDAGVIADIIRRTRGQDTVGSSHLGLWESELANFMVDANIVLSPQRDNRYEFAGSLRRCVLGKGETRVPVGIPIFDVHQSYGANSHEAFLARLIASVRLQRPFFTGEGFIHPDFASAYKYCIVQFGTAGFGAWVDLDKFLGISMKYGQDAKKGKGGKLSARKNDQEIALVRCVEALRELNSPNPQHLQYSIEELPMRVESLRAVLGKGKLIGADIYGTCWNFARIVTALARAGFDYITVRAGDSSTGAAYRVDLQNRGLNLVYLGHLADTALREEGLREQVSLIGEGGVLDAYGAFLALMAGFDFVGVGMRHLIPLGCTACGRCHTGQCAWGITSRAHGPRIDPEEAADRIVNMNLSWLRDMEGLAAGMGMSTHTDVVGCRRFRYQGKDPLLYETFGRAPTT